MSKVSTVRSAAAFAATKSGVVGGRLLLGCVLDTGDDREFAVSWRRTQKGRKLAIVRASQSKLHFAGVNDRGLTIAAIQSSCANGPQLSDEASAAISDALAEADSLERARELLETRRFATCACFVLGDAQSGEIRVVERFAKADSPSGGLAVFGPNDSAENHRPFHPMADVVRRGDRIASDRAAASVGNAPNVDAAYAALSKWLATCGKLDATTCYSNSAASTAPEIGGRRPVASLLLFDPLRQTIWVGSPVVATNVARMVDLERLYAGSSDVVHNRQFAAATPTPAQRITVAERAGDADVPKFFQLDRAPFQAELEPWQTISGVERFKVRFPSPLPSKHPENNTVHAEFFRPAGKGPFRTAIVLHIAGGDFELSRFMSQMLAQKKTACLFVKMPYYGERRPKTGRVRMLSDDLDSGITAMRQNILDLRRACDWIAAQPDCDAQRIAVVGVSLGAIAGSLLAAVDPRVTHAGLIMGGARYDHILFESVEREARESKKRWLATGRTQDDFAKAMTPIDPATYSNRLKNRVVLLICADDDKTIPMASTLALWEATGRQPIRWFPCGHYTMAKHLLEALKLTTTFLETWPKPFHPAL